MQLRAADRTYGTAQALAALVALSLLAACILGASPAPKPPVSKEQRIRGLIEQLGAEDYASRQRAQEELARLGFDAYDELSAAATHPDLEIAARARYLLRLIRVQWISENDPPQVKAILQDYEVHSAVERLRRILRLASLSRKASLPGLCRLVRFERVALLSKYAAVQIVRREPADPAARAQYQQALREHLGKSRQPAAGWLSTYLRLREDPAALAEWTKLAEAEEQTLVRRAVETSIPEFVSASIHREIVAALIYQQAIVELEQGKTEAAEQTARKAREGGPFWRGDQLGAHMGTAYALRERGLFRWAELEYRRVIETGISPQWVRAYIGLSEMFHDQGKHLAAAEARQEILRAVEAGRLRDAALDDLQISVPEIRARMNYFFACHWEEQGDRQKQRKHLEEAIQADPREIDTLIACYRLPDPPAEFRKKVAELISRAASELRTEIEDQPDNPHAYNQFAWLIGNTEGDYDEALAFSHKALELSPDNGAFCDTLARVYFAKGDLENALKYQLQAHELEPHSGLIAKQLKQFQQAHAKKAQKK